MENGLVMNVKDHIASPDDGDSAKPQETAPLRVALDLRMWEMSGLGTYTRELLGGFARLGLPVEWTFIGPESLREKLPPGLAIERWHDFDVPIYQARGFFQYPDLCGIGLFHYPHYNLPRVRARDNLVNVFDLFHLRYGNWLKRRYQGFFLSRLRWNRAHLLTASEKTRGELRQTGKIPLDRISMIPLGPGRSVGQMVRPKPPALTSAAGTALRGPWLLATGIDQPHKNFDFMISALSLYFQRRPNAPPLVWSGLSEESLMRRSRQLPAHLRPRVALEPYSGPERFESLFSGAAALVFPSLDEGFGFPPLEAMARGIPVLCSRREPMTAILGNAPLYFEPSESASLWRMLDRLLDSAGVRDDIVGRGLQQSARYSWDATAWKTCQLYHQLIRGKENGRH